MARFSALLALCAAAATVSATPVVVRDTPVSLPLARHFNVTGSAKIVDLDRARAQVLRNVGHSGSARRKRVNGAAVAVNEQTHYSVLVGIGSAHPQEMYNLLLDTGSANLIIGGGGKPFKKSKSTYTYDATVVRPTRRRGRRRARGAGMWMADLVSRRP